MERKFITKMLLQKYLENRCTDEEIRYVEDWYSGLDYRINGEGEANFPEKEEVYAKLKEEIARTKSERTPVVGFGKKIKWLGGVAALFIFTLVGVNLFTRQAVKPDVSTSEAEIYAYKETTKFVNTSSGIEHKMLPDGSAVWLSPGSSIEYFRKHKDSAREVSFSGEGFFDVAKDKLHPFIIYSGAVQTKVIGTSFSIQAISNSRTIKVSVVTGKVQVSPRISNHATKPVNLEPGQQANYIVATKKIFTAVIPKEVLRKEHWKPLTLSFDEAAFGDIAGDLEKAFDIKIQLSNQNLKNCHLKIDFNNQRLPQVMEWIEKLMDVKCSLNENTLTITGEGCANQ